MDKILLEKFMRQLHSGDMNALDGIYNLTSKSVYLLSLSILRSEEKAKDIMQETFIRLAANIDKYMLDTNALAWISRIARNLSYREYSSGGRNISLDVFGDSLSSDINSEDVWTENVDLNSAMRKLTIEEREIVMLFSIEGYKHREIAEIVGKPMGTVQWIYNKAIKKLRKIMSEGG